MIDFDKELQAILHNDPLGLLSVTAKASNSISADEHLLAAFEEINAFFAQQGREPAASRDIQERKLYSRLQGLRTDPEKALSLQSVDRFGLCVALPEWQPGYSGTALFVQNWFFQPSACAASKKCYARADLFAG